MFVFFVGIMRGRLLRASEYRSTTGGLPSVPSLTRNVRGECA